MGNRYADDIKRIVGIDINQSKLSTAPKRGSIPAARGVGYVDPRSGATLGAAGTPGQTSPKSKRTGDASSTVKVDQSGTTGFDPNDPASGATTATQGQETIANIIDGSSASAKISQPQITDAVGSMYLNNTSLNSLLAEDCATGKTIDIRTRNGFVPPSSILDDLGDTFSSAWTDAETPPDSIGWTSGLQWGVGASPTTWWATTTLAIQERIDLLESGGNTITGRYWVSGNYTSGGTYHLSYDLSGGGSASQDFFITSQACTPDAGDPTCPTTAPALTSWPSDGVYTIKYEQGQFVGSQYDTDIPAEYLYPRSKLDFCWNSGANTGSIEKTKNGGFMIYETSGGAPTGVVRAYDTSGQMIAAFDTTSSLLESYRP